MGGRGGRGRTPSSLLRWDDGVEWFGSVWFIEIWRLRDRVCGFLGLCEGTDG